MQERTDYIKIENQSIHGECTFCGETFTSYGKTLGEVIHHDASNLTSGQQRMENRCVERRAAGGLFRGGPDNMSDRTKSVSSGKQHQRINEGGFDHKSPRPPVPGEERRHFSSDWGPAPSMEWAYSKSSSSPPRKYFNNPNESPAASYAYEPEGGNCRSTSRSSSRHDRRPASDVSPPPGCVRHDRRPATDVSPPPACVRWAQSLHSLLQDPDGVKLFQQYLESEGQYHADTLDFWFACEGLRKQMATEKIQQLVKVIYKKFFVKSALPIDEELKKEIGKNIKSSQCLEPPVTLFDKAQAIVEQLIHETTYPNFLESDLYLHYLQNVQTLSSSSSSDFSNELSNLTNVPDPLPTLHEDMELVMNPPVHISHNSGTGSVSTGYHTPNIGAAGPVRLTKDLLLISQKHRAVDVRPKSETFLGMYMYRGGPGAHAAYNSYNPNSRQDSELHSLSSHSDARTESDNLSITDSSVDGRSLGRSTRRKAVIEARKTREYAALNQETNMNQILIPRTQRVDTKQCQPMNRDTFATILIEKLEAVKRHQDQQELLDRKLKESESMNSMNDIQSRELANAIKEKLQLEDDNDQDILDQHVSRVFSDLTPALSPGLSRPHSPPRNRHVQSAYMRPKRKEKDGFSTFSIDSGNVHDFADGSEHKLAMVKSKSMPEYAEERFVRGTSGRRSSKKALTELTDSGVSVVYDPITPVAPVKDNRVLAWLMESDKSGRGASHTHSEMSAKHRSHRTSSATSPSAGRRRKGFGSRSSSLERGSNSSALGPAQPFVADPSMPPLPSPNIAVQLEEARRRLLEDDVRIRPKQRSSCRYYPDMAQSSQSTLRKSMRVSRPSMPAPVGADEVTTVVFNFCEEQFPYRTKIPGTQVTLRQFKEYLPKKGNYRYFFKTVCEELGNQVIQEEVSNDSEILPLWEGKIMAQVKPID